MQGSRAGQRRATRRETQPKDFKCFAPFYSSEFEPFTGASFASGNATDVVY